MSDTLTPIAALYHKRAELTAEVERLHTLKADAEARFQAALPEVPVAIRVKSVNHAFPVNENFVWKRKARGGKQYLWVPSIGWEGSIQYLTDESAICEAKRKQEIAMRYASDEEIVRASSGLTAAEDALDQAYSALWTCEKELLTSDPQSFGDVRIQAEVMKAELEGSEPDAETLEKFLNSIIHLAA